MGNFKNRVQESSKFYNESFINFDYKLTELNYKTISKFFNKGVGLELGPAVGQMTKYLIHNFTSLHLVEGAVNLLDQIPQYENIVKHHSFFEDFQTEIKFNTIVMGHVLEHIEKPISVLEKVYKWLEDDGNLIISVPNANSIHRLVAVEMGLLSSKFELNKRDYELGHYRVYDMDSLKKEITDAGFKVNY